jgi:hypothetical protein
MVPLGLIWVLVLGGKIAGERVQQRPVVVVVGRIAVASSWPGSAHVRTVASEDRWMVTPGCDE